MNRGKWHELLDRTHVFSCQFNAFVYDEVQDQKDVPKHIRKKVARISELLGELYQDVGEEGFSFNE